MNENRFYDDGLQLERTELAWRRTTLSLAVGSLVALRILPLYSGNAAWSSVGLVGLGCAGAVWILARRRSRLAHRALVAAPSERDARLPGAELLFATALGVFAIAALAMVVIAIGARA